MPGNVLCRLSPALSSVLTCWCSGGHHERRQSDRISLAVSVAGRSRASPGVVRRRGSERTFEPRRGGEEGKATRSTDPLRWVPQPAAAEGSRGVLGLGGSFQPFLRALGAVESLGRLAAPRDPASSWGTVLAQAAAVSLW